MDLQQEWNQLLASRLVPDAEEHQDELRAAVVRSCNQATAALKALHEHEREHGQLGVMPFPVVDDLLFWLALTVDKTRHLG